MTRVATIAFALMTAIALPAFAQGPAAPVTTAKPATEAAKPAATQAVVPASKAVPVAAKPADPAKKPVAAAATTTAPITKTP